MSWPCAKAMDGELHDLENEEIGEYTDWDVNVPKEVNTRLSLLSQGMELLFMLLPWPLSLSEPFCWSFISLLVVRNL